MVVGLCVVYVGAAGVLHADQAWSEKDRHAFHELLQAIHAQLCQQPTAEVCQQFARFQAGHTPTLPVGASFTVGKVVINAQEPERHRFLVLALQRSAHRLQIATFYTTPDTDQEWHETQKYIRESQAGYRDPQHPLHQFLHRMIPQRTGTEILFYEAHVHQDDFLLWVDPHNDYGHGAVFLRQHEQMLYLFSLIYVPKMRGSFDRVPGFVFGYLPVP
jgi:hypothetical protein